ncbi:MAG: GDP-mannose 4,6-dehydratase [Candidatus Atribacteria bacterium]|nr:GDP-mannose 4,6-dehydratase [Candidatus Atribacteria bacterium]
MKRALITGVTGQDGSYLAEFLIKKGYEVHGIKRRSSSFNTSRIDHIYPDPHKRGEKFFIHFGDLTDATSLIRLVQEIQPEEIYNLAAQSHVKVSFETPEYTANADALGTLRILEAVRILGMEKNIRFYQASTSELFGKPLEYPQNELTPFYPRSPYAVAKLYAHWITINYREEGDIEIIWEGKGKEEKGIERRTGKVMVEVDPFYFRPTEVDFLLGDAKKAKAELGWEPKVYFRDLVKLMIRADMELFRNGQEHDQTVVDSQLERLDEDD